MHQKRFIFSYFQKEHVEGIENKLFVFQASNGNVMGESQNEWKLRH